MNDKLTDVVDKDLESLLAETKNIAKELYSSSDTNSQSSATATHLSSSKNRPPKSRKPSSNSEVDNLIAQLENNDDLSDEESSSVKTLTRHFESLTRSSPQATTDSRMQEKNPSNNSVSVEKKQPTTDIITFEELERMLDQIESKFTEQNTPEDEIDALLSLEEKKSSNVRKLRDFFEARSTQPAAQIDATVKTQTNTQPPAPSLQIKSQANSGSIVGKLPPSSSQVGKSQQKKDIENELEQIKALGIVSKKKKDPEPPSTQKRKKIQGELGQTRIQQFEPYARNNIPSHAAIKELKKKKHWSHAEKRMWKDALDTLKSATTKTNTHNEDVQIIKEALDTLPVRPANLVYNEKAGSITVEERQYREPSDNKEAISLNTITGVDAIEKDNAITIKQFNDDDTKYATAIQCLLQMAENTNYDNESLDIACADIDVLGVLHAYAEKEGIQVQQYRYTGDINTLSTDDRAFVEACHSNTPTATPATTPVAPTASTQHATTPPNSYTNILASIKIEDKEKTKTRVIQDAATHAKTNSVDTEYAKTLRQRQEDGESLTRETFHPSKRNTVPKPISSETHSTSNEAASKKLANVLNSAPSRTTSLQTPAKPANVPTAPPPPPTPMTKNVHKTANKTAGGITSATLQATIAKLGK